MQLLTSYPWPGNILQLANVIERAVILEDGELITPASLLSPGDLVAAGAAGEEIIPELADSEYALLVRALRECN